MLSRLLRSIINYWIINYFWILIVFLLLPLSKIFDIFFYFRCWLMFKILKTTANHSNRVKYVQMQVKGWNSAGCKIPMCSGRPPWQTMSIRQPLYKKYLQCIDINLRDVLKVDTKNLVVHVEPLVSVGQLTSILNPMGWTLPIVPELDDLTVGGLIMGCGIETSSHKHGLFQHICEAYELVLADGSLKICSRTENAELFYAVPWSHGTLGFLVGAIIRIVPAMKYVRVEYRPIYSQEEMLQVIAKESYNYENDFVEALAFSKNTFVIMTAVMTNHYEIGQINSIGKWYKPWFFIHVQSFLKKGPKVEYIPLKDYYHRHSRSLFWEMQDIISFGNNVIFRWVGGWLLPPKISFLKFMSTYTRAVMDYYEKYHVIQDVLVPLKMLKESIDFIDERLKLYPLWLCPFMLFNDPGLVHPVFDKSEMYIDIGVYGIPKEKSYNRPDTLRQIEAFARRMKGFHMLYGECFQTREEFYQMFDHILYNHVRRTLKCETAFPDIHDKMKNTLKFK